MDIEYDDIEDFDSFTDEWNINRSSFLDSIEDEENKFDVDDEGFVDSFDS